MILLVRHPPVHAAGRCYGRLDLAVADPAHIAALAAEIARHATLNPPPLAGGVRGGVRSGTFDCSVADTRFETVFVCDPSPNPLPQGEGAFARPGVVWTSPARRCRAIAEALGRHTVDPRLQELDFGAWEGLAWDCVPRSSLDAWAADPWGFAPPGGESGAALVARVSAFAEILEDGDVVITHGGPLKVLCAIASGTPVDLLAAPPPPGSVRPIHRPRRPTCRSRSFR